MSIQNMPTHKRFQDLTGQVFGRLTAISYDGMVENRAAWVCRCECGQNVVVLGKNLKQGLTQSCGCLHREMLKTSCVTHGNARLGKVTREYQTWVRMIDRCENANYKDFHRYGGRGITVCERWRESFEAFLADMGERPSDDHSIDRFPDTNGNYEPSNCRWATKKEQANNRRSNVKHLVNGQMLCVPDIAKILNVPESLLYKWIRRHGSEKGIAMADGYEERKAHAAKNR
jgi:hypothetical protein